MHSVVRLENGTSLKNVHNYEMVYDDDDDYDYAVIVHHKKVITRKKSLESIKLIST